MARAQVALSTEVSPKAGRLDDLFIFTVTVEGLSNAAPPSLSGQDDFDLTFLGPRTSISIINGSVSSRASFVYQLTPKREGTLKTPEAKVTIAGKTYSAPSIELHIGPRATEPQGGNGPPSEEAFLRQTVTPTTVYMGEQFNLSLKLYFRVDLRNPSIEEPTTDGVWQETIAENQQSRATINNLEYDSVEAQKAIFALRPGKIQIPPKRLKAMILEQKQRLDPFDLNPFSDAFLDQFFDRGQLKPFTTTSNEVSVDVKPLPPLPAAFKKSAPSVAIVGPTSMRVDYPLTAINTGETKTITVEVTSEGNLNTLKSLPIDVPSHFKIYEERPEIRSENRAGKLIQRKIFRYSVLSLAPGLARIPGPKLTYFDPSTGEYKFATTADIAFPVQGEDLSAKSSSAVPATEERHEDASIATAVPTMPPLPIAPPLEYEDPSLVDRLSGHISIQLALLILAGVIGLGCIAMLAPAKKPDSDPKEISAVALKEVSSMKELEAFVRRVISLRLSLASESSTMDELRSRVATSLSDKNLALSITSLLDDIEVYNYGGNGPDRDREVPTLKERLAMILMQWRR